MQLINYFLKIIKYLNFPTLQLFFKNQTIIDYLEIYFSNRLPKMSNPKKT